MGASGMRLEVFVRELAGELNGSQPARTGAPYREHLAAAEDYEMCPKIASRLQKPDRVNDQFSVVAVASRRREDTLQRGLFCKRRRYGNRPGTGRWPEADVKHPVERRSFPGCVLHSPFEHGV